MENLKNQATVSIETIVSGNFATQGKGNFSAYSASGERYFISKKAMETIGITDDATFASKAPLFAIVTSKTYNEIVTEENILDFPDTYKAEDLDKVKKDSEGNPITFDRQEASAVFTEEDKAVTAFTAKRKMLKKIEEQEQLDALQFEEKIGKAKLQIKINLDKFATENSLTPEKLQALATLSF